jgi:curved DNA-binding protein CbpA
MPVSNVSGAGQGWQDLGSSDSAKTPASQPMQMPTPWGDAPMARGQSNDARPRSSAFVGGFDPRLMPQSAAAGSFPNMTPPQAEPSKMRYGPAPAHEQPRRSRPAGPRPDTDRGARAQESTSPSGSNGASGTSETPLTPEQQGLRNRAARREALNLDPERLSMAYVIAKSVTPEGIAELKDEFQAFRGDLKKNFRKLALQNHPDKGGDTAKFQSISDAYEKLGLEIDNALTFLDAQEAALSSRANAGKPASQTSTSGSQPAQQQQRPMDTRSNSSSERSSGRAFPAASQAGSSDRPQAPPKARSDSHTMAAEPSREAASSQPASASSQGSWRAFGSFLKTSARNYIAKKMERRETYSTDNHSRRRDSGVDLSQPIGTASQHRDNSGRGRA